MEAMEGAVMEKPSQEKLPSPEERAELVLLGLAREQTVERLCQQSGISKTLFYQWMRRGREGLLKALEAKKPGRKPTLPPESSHAINLLEERIKHMEQEISGLRKDRDRFKTLAEVGQRIIQRNGWNPEPLPRVKKKGGRTRRRASGMPENGPLSGDSASRSPDSPSSGASAATPTGDGSAEGSPAQGAA